MQIKLPCPPSSVPGAPAGVTTDRGERAGAARALRVLVAEDNTINQRLMTRALVQLGHTGTLVGNGAQALAALAAQRFDLVLMDDHMPVMTGVEALEALGAGRGRGTAHPPVVIVTANDMPGDRDAYLKRGASGYLAKPVHPDTLRAEIDRVLAADGHPAPATSTRPARNAAPNHGLLADRVPPRPSTMRQ